MENLDRRHLVLGGLIAVTGMMTWGMFSSGTLSPESDELTLLLRNSEKIFDRKLTPFQEDQLRREILEIMSSSRL